MAWVYLFIAGIFEWGWPIGLKFAWTKEGIKIWPLIGAIVSMIFSGSFLLLAQRTIPVGTSYAVWTGIGSVGAFFLGIFLLDEPAELGRFLCVGLIIAGIIGLRFVTRM